jgi:hypothetical protein
MGSMTDPSQAPGERRLPYPPSDRYAVPDDVPPAIDDAASPTRGVMYAAAAAVVGAGAMTLLGGVLAVSAGLLVVAGATGWAVAVGLRAGGGPHIATARRVRLGLLLTTLAVALGQLGLWLYAGYEGGVLGPVDYLSETFGLLVPLQLLIAWIVAWATAR